MVQITIAGTVYQYPDVGESPNWGREATTVIQALAEALNTLFSPGDILSTKYNIDNNVSVAQPVNGLLFDSNITRAATIPYAIYRVSTDEPTGNAEEGSLFIVYDDNASAGNKWVMSRTTLVGSSGVIFDITDLGQVTYESTDIGVIGYSGSVTFSAKTLIR